MQIGFGMRTLYGFFSFFFLRIVVLLKNCATYLPLPLLALPVCRFMTHLPNFTLHFPYFYLFLGPMDYEIILFAHTYLRIR